jgi:hypothetical protein
MRILMTVFAALNLIAGTALAQYDLYFLTNGEFQSSLNDWYTALPNNGPAPGVAEWSPSHGGSAHLETHGSSTVQLMDCVGTTIYPGDTVYMRVTQTAIESPGHVLLKLGSGYQAAPFSQGVAAPQQAGEHEVALVCNRFYSPGTALLATLSNWSGNSEAWVHYVRLARAGNAGVGFADDTRNGAVPPGPARLVEAHPTISQARVSFNFDMASAVPVRVAVYDASGSLVRNLRHECVRGPNCLVWDGLNQENRPLPAGSYFYCISAPTGSIGTGKVVLAN